MTVSDEPAPGQPAPGQTQSLSLDFDLPHPPEEVWRALTDPALLAEWLLPVVGFGLAPGTAFTFTTQAYPGWDGTVHCQMLEAEPYRTLRYAWRVPFAGAALDTVVTRTLTATASETTPSGTRLTIGQSGFQPDQPREFGGARYGWTMMGGRLVALPAQIP